MTLRLSRFLTIGITIITFFSTTRLAAQLSGTFSIPGDYATVTAAVTALNSAGVGTDGVTFNIAANHTETIASTISLTATGIAANPIVFQKDPATSGANPLITAYTGGTGTPSTALQDGIFRLVGSDYVTIDRIDLQGNPANTSNPSTMEYGYALYKQSLSNGCQFVTISNCVITLNRLNNEAGIAPMVDGSVGILSANSTFSAATTILAPTTAAGTNSNNNFFGNTIQNCNTGIALIGFAAGTPFIAADQNNDVGGNSVSTGNIIRNFGGASGAALPAVGIRTLAQYEFNCSFNTVNNNTGAGVNHENILRGIYINTAASARSTINNNTITIKGGGTTQVITAIENASGSTAVGNEVSISNNTITNCSYTTATTGSFYGIYNLATPAILNINSNTLLNNSTAATATGVYYPIWNNGAATITININENIINGVNFTAATSSTFYGIYNQAGPASAELTISNNNFQNISYSALSSGINTYIINGAATLSQTITSNKFTNLNVNTTGNIIFISNSVAVSATGNQVVDDNSIEGSFTRTNTATSGSLTMFYSIATCVAGSVISNSNNNFSNINVFGAATIAGWVNTDAGAGAIAKTIQGNVFSNWTAEAGNITVLNVNITGSLNATVSNLISNISSAATVIGISTTAGNDNIYSNSISNLSTTGGGAFVVTGIAVGAGTTKNIYQNTISNLSGNTLTGTINGITIAGSTTVNIYNNVVSGIAASANTTGTVNGIWVSAGTNVSVYRNKIFNISSSSSAVTTGISNGILISGTTANANITLRNNIIGDIKAIAASLADAVRGISLISSGTTSNLNVYYNTIHLNATSVGANFGTSGIYHLTSATSTIAQLFLRNNIIHNLSTANGTGLTVAYRRSSTTLTNYNTASNNNLYYGGTPSASYLIFYDLTNSDQTLTTFKSRMSTRDAASVTEDLVTGNKFLSTTGSSADYLHMDDTKTSVVKGGAVNISGILTDFDNDVRQGNPGYSGTGAAPDIGADEYAGITYTPLSGNYNVGAGQTFTSLTNAGGLFAKINRVGLSGNVSVKITSDLTEDGSEALNEWTETGLGNYTLDIAPNNATPRLISGDVAAGLIRINGADKLIINGLQGVTNTLTFRNTNTSGTGTAFTFINGASNNTIRYCNIEAFTNSSNAVVLFSSAATFDGGNSFNLVEFNEINATVSGNNGSMGILSAGSNVGGFENSINTIANNKIYNYRDRGMEIKSTGSIEWIISGNSFYNGSISSAINYAASSTLHGIRILGGPGHNILNNYIGGSAPLAAGAAAIYSSTLGTLLYQGILCNSNSSAGNPTNIKGNIIANITFSSVPTAASSLTFYGIETNGAFINIGGNTNGDGNTIGSNSVNGSIKVTTTTTVNTNTSLIRGINCNSRDGVVNRNQVGGFDINNVASAGTAGASTFLGIYINQSSAPAQINNNIIGSTGIGAATHSIRILNTSTALATSITGISLGTSVGTAVQVDGNIIKNISYQGTIAYSSGIIGIANAAKATAEINITGNTFENNSTAANSTAGLFYGINNTGGTGSLRINNNQFIGNLVNGTVTIFNAIRNTVAVFNEIEINNNILGTALSPLVTFTVANSGAQVYITNTAGGPLASLSISNNHFQNINYAVNGTGANTFISNTAVTLSQNIIGNIFTNLNVQTSGNNTFITNSVALPANGFQNVNNNSISGTYTKRVGNTITFITSTATCGAGSTISISNNNFSNVTVTGTTTVTGIINTDAGTSVNKTIQGNYLTNWSGGATNAITALTVNVNSPNNATNGNVISNISSAGTITGISSTVAGARDNIYSNTIDQLITTGAAAFTNTGISITGGTLKNIYQNTISNISGSNIVTGSVRGILISGGTAINVYQNTIFGVSSGAVTTGTTSGVWVSAGVTITVSRNKIYDISCSGTALTAAIYGIQVSGTTASLNCTINNNLVGDLRTPSLSNVDAIRGIGIINSGATSTMRVYYNSIYINATSSGANFGSSGLYHTTSTTATTSSLDLRNNSITNTSTANGTGFTVAYRRSSATLTNFATASNNNMLYAGTPATSNLVFYESTGAGEQTIAGYKTRVGVTRETASISEELVASGKFLSTVGTSQFFLHMDLNKTTGLKSGGIQISGFVEDFDGDIRFGNAGYGGNGSAPDIGADEFAGYQIQPFSGIVYVGTGNNYTSLTNSNGLFSKINSLGFNGNVSVLITSDLAETGTEALNQWTETGGSGYTLSIQPDATTARLISGNALAGLIRFNGADRVKVDGGSGKYLTFRNTNTSGTSGTAFTFINGATYDTIRNCKIEAFANASNGVILFSTSASAASGNSFNRIEYNNISGNVGANTSNTCIYSAGTAGKENASVTLTNNNIFGFKDRGIELTATGSTMWNINANSIYNGNISGSFNYDAATLLHGIRVLGGSGYSISNNMIGGSDSLLAGSNAVYSSTLGNVSYKAIVLTTTSGSPTSNIKGNSISKITVNSIPQAAGSNTFMGIETTGSGINIGGATAGEGNTIGSNTSNGAISITTTTSSNINTSIITGINCVSAGGEVIGNRVGGMNISNVGTDPAPSIIKGISINNSTTPNKVNSNIIGSAGTGAATNSIQVLSGSSATTTVFTAIEIGASATSAIQIDANIIRNISNLSTTSSGSFTAINNIATVAGAVITITNNHISAIRSASNSDANSGTYAGIISTSPSVIYNDTIINILHAATGTVAQVKGIHVSGAFAHSVYNNWLATFSTASTKTADAETATPSGYTIIGILNGASVSGQLIYGNTLTDFSSTTTDVVNTAIVGIGTITAGNNGNIYRNRIASFTNTATGTSTLPGITGIMGFNGTYNVYNNVIKLDNASNTNGIKLYGINHSTTNSWNYYYNSIRIAGSASGTTTRTAGFVRTVNGAVLFRNNIFVNERTGTGNHFAISNKVATPATNWSSSASNYNNLYSATSTTIGEWGNGGNTTFVLWKTNSGGDGNSASRPVSFISSAYDLVPVENSNCGLDNSGIPVTSPISISTDHNSVARHASTPDIGAYEFSYTAFIVTATSNSPVCTGANVDVFSTSGSALLPTFSWSKPDSINFSTSQNTTVLAVAGYYVITVTDVNGCFVKDSTLVSILPPATGSFTYPGTPVCSDAGTANVSFSGTTGGVFTSTAGLSLNSTSGSVDLGTSTPGTYTITYTVNLNGCGQYQTTAPLFIKLAGTWTGAVNSDWHTGANWLCGSVPGSNSDVLIPGSLGTYPIVSTGTAAVRNISILSGASLIVSSNIFQISANITNAGSFTATTGNICLNGTSAQNIPASTFVLNTIKALTINNTAGVILGGPLNLTDVLTISNGSLSTGDFLILKSTATATARVANITSVAATPVIGNVTVERYIPGRRKYRLMTSSVTTSASATLTPGQEALSIWGNWQNQGINVTGNTGTIITGGTAADGFDQQTTTASMYTYNAATRLYVGYTTANGKNTKYTPLKAGVAYYMFLYGDRVNGISATTPNATVIKATGTLLTGNQTYTTSSSIPLSGVTNRFTLIGNPFASPIDWATVSKNDLVSTYWGWDPNLNGTGGYVTVNTSGGVTLISPFSGTTGLNQYIQPGQGFFVQTSGAAPQLIIREQDKVGNYNANAFRTNEPGFPLLAVNLLTHSGTSKFLTDGTLAAFQPTFSSQVNEEDAIKMTSSAETIGFSNSGNLLSIDARPLPNHNDTMRLNIFRITKSQYTLQIFTRNFETANVKPYLEDNYLQTSQPLSVIDTNNIVFNVITSVPASYDTNRFKIVFKQTGVLPVTFTNIRATKKDKVVQVDWSVAEEKGIVKYEVERSDNGIDFAKTGEVLSTGNNTVAKYAWTDNNPYPANNYYRIRTIQADGKSSVSNVAVVKMDHVIGGITIYPNPVKNHQVNLYFKELLKGNYSVQLFNSIGVQVYNGAVFHLGGSGVYIKEIPKILPAGFYIVKLKSDNYQITERIKID